MKNTIQFLLVCLFLCWLPLAQAAQSDSFPAVPVPTNTQGVASTPQKREQQALKLQEYSPKTFKNSHSGTPSWANQSFTGKVNATVMQAQAGLADGYLLLYILPQVINGLLALCVFFNTTDTSHRHVALLLLHLGLAVLLYRLPYSFGSLSMILGYMICIITLMTVALRQSLVSGWRFGLTSYIRLFTGVMLIYVGIIFRLALYLS